MYRRKMVIDGEHDGRCVSEEVVIQIGRIPHERKGQHDRFATLDGIEVMYD